ncbi:MAG TPA: amidohydrolase family protein [Candidatus Baltobacteraceae bacterium]|jgi:imidazolonepropionase-like amidohydrolase|nr:amidohydrolase family protein [Candidatus Baltobacteraceae bacterium]
MIVRAGVLYDGTLEPPKQNVDVIIADGRIAELRAAGGECDLEAACVTPGLVNAHAHVEGSGEPDLMAMIHSTTPNQRLLRAVANAGKSVKAGVTTIRDVGSSNKIAPDVREAIEEGRIPGPRMRTAGAALCMTGGHGWPIGRAVDSPWDARKAVREQMWAGADCIKLIATGGVLTKGAVPGNAQLTPDELAAAIDEAHSHGLRVAAHAIGTRGIKNALNAGIDSIEHGTMLDDECIDIMKRRGVYLVPTLSAPTCILAHLEDGHQPKYITDKARSLTEVMLANLRRAFDAGVRFAGGSDAGTPYNYHEDYAQEVELMWAMLGMTPQQALHAATSVAADLIGLHKGLLAVGEPADVLLLARDAGEDVRALREPQLVLKNGLIQ